MTELSELDKISYDIVGAAIEVHQYLGGPGLIEKVYEESLVKELALRNRCVVRQLQVPIEYKGEPLATPLILDLLVDDKVIIECKACEKHNLLFEAQLLTYLRLMRLRLGLVINFGEKYVKDGVHRVLNG